MLDMRLNYVVIINDSRLNQTSLVAIFVNLKVSLAETFSY